MTRTKRINTHARERASHLVAVNFGRELACCWAAAGVLGTRSAYMRNMVTDAPHAESVTVCAIASYTRDRLSDGRAHQFHFSLASVRARARTRLRSLPSPSWRASACAVRLASRDRRRRHCRRSCCLPACLPAAAAAAVEPSRIASMTAAAATMTMTKVQPHRVHDSCIQIYTQHSTYSTYRHSQRMIEHAEWLQERLCM